MKIPAAIVALLLLVCSCTKQPAPVPREHAYPRPTLYPDTYHSVAMPFGIDSIAVNDSAQIIPNAERADWFDIVYPAYNITINCSLTAVNSSTFESALNNRGERLMRNIDGQYAEAINVSGATLLIARQSLRTPVQFLATDSATWILSGVAVADFPPTTNPDSVAPIINSVANDIIHLLNHL